MNPPKPIYHDMLELVREKNYFVLTTNVDHCLRKAGFDAVILDVDGILRTAETCDRALELIGRATLRDTFAHIREDVIVCSTGQLGGEWYLNEFDPIFDLPANGYLTSVYSGNVDGGRFQELLDYVARYPVELAPERVFSLEQMPEARAWLDGAHSFGKVVILIE